MPAPALAVASAEQEEWKIPLVPKDPVLCERQAAFHVPCAASPRGAPFAWSPSRCAKNQAADIRKFGRISVKKKCSL
jgi:hypothetical protein